MRIERWFYIVPLRLRSLFRRQSVEADLDDEFRDHIERQTAEYVRQGASPSEVRTRALRAFGSVDQHKEAARDARGVAGIGHAVQDVTFAVRMLRKIAPRIRTLVVAAFAALALVLASIGVYGVTSHVTAQRTAEIGIRMALGARSFQVVSTVAGRIAVYSCAGLLIGITGAAVAARVIRALLYGIGPMDVAAFAGGGVVAIGIAAAAAWIPARRATRVDPGAALRSE